MEIQARVIDTINTIIVADVGKRMRYMFKSSEINDVIVYKFIKLEYAKLARCAAHMIAHKRGWKFKTKIRENDAGHFEITIKRVV